MLDQHELDGPTERFLAEGDDAPEPKLTITGDWIEHDGTECPVSDLAMVKVWFRMDRDQRAADRANQGQVGAPAHTFEGWVRDGSPVDVLAYQVVA